MASLDRLPETLGLHTRYFDLPGLRMHAAVAGPADGPLVVLLHGFPEFWYSWRRQIPALAAAGYRVVAPDQRGYGLTEKCGPYDIDVLVQDVVNLIQANGHASAFIVGHDWGAAVAWHLVEAHPNRVRRLAILNVPHPRLAQRAILGGDWRQTLKSWYILAVQLPWLPERLLSLDNYGPMRRGIAYGTRPGAFTPEDMGYYVEAWRQPGALTAMLNWYRAYAQRTIHALRRLGEPIQCISVPTLILWGDQDVALEKTLADASARLVDDAQVIHFPAACHFVQADQPEAVTQGLLNHFKTRREDSNEQSSPSGDG